MDEIMNLKSIPYGVSDFADFSKYNLYYVDKTSLIRNIEKKGKFLLFTRPRRFGKSLFLSMLEYYYDISQKDRFKLLFHKTDILKNPTPEHNSYFILKFNFSEADPDITSIKESFTIYIKETTISFIAKYEKYLNLDAKAAQAEINIRNTASDALRVFLNYCSGIKQKLYVIIDEYDNFANTILSTSGEDVFKNITHGEGFLRSFFNMIKAGTTGSDTPISRLFMTGVSPITLDDVTSGFNIATNVTMDSDIHEILGFTHPEVETLINYYRQTGKFNHTTEELIDLMTHWYNHYRFSPFASDELFNTSQVLYFMDKYMIDSHIPIKLIDYNARIDYNKLRHLVIIDKKGKPETNGNFLKLQKAMESEDIITSIEPSFPIQQLGEPDNFYSLLFYFGLLTIKGLTASQKTILTIPNEFAKNLYYEYIKSVWAETDRFKIDMNAFSNLIDNMAFKGIWIEAIEYIAERMENSLGIRDLFDREKALQVFWNVYFGLNPLYIVYSEKELNQGFADLVMMPMLTQFPGILYSYLIEFKYIKPADYKKEGNKEKIESLRIEAETQLNKYSKDERFIKSIGQTTLKKLVIIFCGNRMVYRGEA